MDKESDPQNLLDKLAESERKLTDLQKENDKINSENEELKNDVHSYRELILSSPSMITLLKGKDLIIQTANKPILDFWQKDEKVVGKPLIEVHPEIREQGLEALLHNVLESEKPQYGYEMPVHISRENKKDLAYFNFVYQPQKNRQNKIEEVAVIAQEVTPKAIYHSNIKKNEFKFRQLIDSSDSLLAIFIGDNYVIDVANNPIREVWGKGLDVIGKPLFELLPELKTQGIKELLDGVYNTGIPYHDKEVAVELVIHGKPEIRYFDITYQPQKDPCGNIIGVANYAADVTRQALLNKKISESEKEFRELVNFMPHKIAMSNAEGEPVFFNNSWINYTGRSVQDLLENSWQELIHPDDREFTKQLINQGLQTGEDIEIELRIYNREKRAKWHLARATAIRNDEGVINSWIISNTEIHKLKEEEKRKEDFLKLVSHELKTPVTSIKGYVQLLLAMLPKQNGEADKKLTIKPYLNRIESQVERLIRLLTEMLDMSKIEQNELELKNERFNLNDHVEEVIEDITYSHKDIQIELNHEFNCEVVADRNRIGQVIINLVTNAVKYSPNTKHIQIRIYEYKAKFVGITIKDFGIGIAPKEQNKIFKRFYRVSGNKDDTYDGFGIGLYLSKEIIKRHHGKIYVNSEIGKGSEFTFVLPLNRN